jgi:hypothetical protein
VKEAVIADRRAEIEVCSRSASTTETFLQLAKQQHSQVDINASLTGAITELAREMKIIEHKIHSLGRSIQMNRRF